MTAPRDESARGPRGFTLLEVLIACSIAALGLGALYDVAARSLRASSTAAAYEDALVRARSRLTLATDGDALTPGAWEGDDGGGYRWQVRVAPVATAAANPALGLTQALELFEIGVSITWQEGDHRRDVSLRTQHIGHPVGAR